MIRIGCRLTLSKLLVLATVAALSLAVPVVTGAIEAAAFAAGQLRNPLIGSAIDPESRFEVVSIKLSDPSAQLRLGMIPGRIDLVGASVRMVAARSLWRRRHRAVVAFLSSYVLLWSVVGWATMAVVTPLIGGNA